MYVANSSGRQRKKEPVEELMIGCMVWMTTQNKITSFLL